MSWKEEQRKLSQRARMGRFYFTGKAEAGKLYKFSSGIFEVQPNGSIRKVTNDRAAQLLQEI